MKLTTAQLTQASPTSRAMLFRLALAEAAVPTTPTAIANREDVSAATVTKVMQWRSVGGAKVRRVQVHIARCLQAPVATLFPVRGPAIAGGGFLAQRKNWKT